MQLICLNQNKELKKRVQGEKTDTNSSVFDGDCDFHSFTKLVPTIVNNTFIFAGSSMELSKEKL